MPGGEEKISGTNIFCPTQQVFLSRGPEQSRFSSLEFEKRVAARLRRIGPKQFVDPFARTATPRRSHCCGWDDMMIADQKSVRAAKAHATIKISFDAPGVRGDPIEVIAFPLLEDAASAHKSDLRLIGCDVRLSRSELCAAAEMIFSHHTGRRHQRPPRGI